MKATIILQATYEDACWGALAERYHERYSISDVVELASRRYPEVMLDEEDVDVEGEIEDESNGYILTHDDSLGEIVRIYRK